MKRRDFLATMALGLTSITNAQERLVQSEDLSPPGKEEVYLTIDDGPLNYMGEILENLHDKNVVFYLVGERLEQNISLACRALEKGNIIGNHSYSHPSFSSISISKGKDQILKTDDLINEVYEKVQLKRSHKLFRFPYGDEGSYYSNENGWRGSKERKEEFALFLDDLGYKTQFWDIDTDDWKHYSSSYNLSLSAILRNCSKAKQGDIILCHDKPITAEYVVPFFADSEKYELILPQANA